MTAGHRLPTRGPSQHQSFASPTSVLIYRWGLVALIRMSLS